MNAFDLQAEGRRQAEAGINLLCVSRLVAWNTEKSRFIPVEQDVFEAHNASVHSKYGRLICWQIFSAGAEFLAKGVCMEHQIDIRKQDKKGKLKFPTGPIEAWVNDVKSEAAATEPVLNFGSIGDLYKYHMPKLFQKSDAKGVWVVAAYRLLA